MAVLTRQQQAVMDRLKTALATCDADPECDPLEILESFQMEAELSVDLQAALQELVDADPTRDTTTGRIAGVAVDQRKGVHRPGQ